MHVAQCENDLQEAKADLRKHLGQLVYLQNLAKVCLLHTPPPPPPTHTHTHTLTRIASL